LSRPKIKNQKIKESMEGKNQRRIILKLSSFFLSFDKFCFLLLLSDCLLLLVVACYSLLLLDCLLAWQRTARDSVLGDGLETRGQREISDAGLEPCLPATAWATTAACARRSQDGGAAHQHREQPQPSPCPRPSAGHTPCVRRLQRANEERKTGADGLTPEAGNASEHVVLLIEESIDLGCLQQILRIPWRSNQAGRRAIRTNIKIRRVEAEGGTHRRSGAAMRPM
jgi:hypothetical protein